MAEEKQVVLGPCSLKQQMALLDRSDILIVGGAAGASKSYMALLKALDHCSDPAARVLIVRRSYPTLKVVGGLVDESKNMYKQFGAVFNSQQLEWRWPNGAVIKFMAMPDDLSELQGAAATLIICDEGTELSVEGILMLKSRLRGARFKGVMQLVITCNPDRQSYLYDWVKYSLDEETGIPKSGTEKILRWFVVLNNKIYWANSKEELYKEHGMGYTEGVDFIPSSLRFIAMNIYDNPVLMKNNPGYLANLLSMSRVNQQRFLKGSWTAVIEGNSVFNRSWVQFVDNPPVNPTSKVRSWDLAYSVPSESYPNPDWTVGVLVSRDRFGTYCIEDVKRFRKLTDGVVKEIIKTSIDDGQDIPVTIPKDNGGGKAASSIFLRMFGEAGINVRGIPITNHSSKMQRFLPFCTYAESGSLTMVKADWNDDFLTELEYFCGSRNQKDDQVDAVADAFITLSRQVNTPVIAPPSMTKPNPVPSI
jgi:predicted phage terminase large subunit-like protein